MSSQESQAPPTTTRRKFMQTVIATLGGIITAGFAIPAVGYVVGPALQEKVEAWFQVGTASKIPVGEPTLLKISIERKSGWIVDTQEHAYYVYTEDGQNYQAVSNVCTHLGCRVRWIEDQEIFFCPCHNASFAKNGDVLDGPPPRPLDKAELKIEDDQIYIKGG
ncbi:MAG TPA: ubiquinol-cytochrome c reductase iron-sulfur subunit [Chloroflexi bacterium]|nr:MAG: hypothetical protein B6243_00920 [Anaerolineaceae bacterium 4572_5.2]HEY83520.1 ubiquinol-cytochrome c reductase iron-sulfur subunit [Chloroflexota bacterium]